MKCNECGFESSDYNSFFLNGICKSCANKRCYYLYNMELSKLGKKIVDSCKHYHYDVCRHMKKFDVCKNCIIPIVSTNRED